MNDLRLSPLQVSPIGQPIEPPLPEANNLWQTIPVEIDGKKNTSGSVVNFVLPCGLQSLMEDASLVGKDPRKSSVGARTWMFALPAEKDIEVPVPIQIGDHEPCLS
jgi:hypothetical protein